MKVLFLKDVGGVGQSGTMKEVNDGYAMNFLIARGFAVQATPEKVKAHEAEVKRAGEEQAKQQAALVHLVKSLENAHIETTVRATEKGGLFKSITSDTVIKLLLEQKGAHITKDMVEMEKPIKEVGDHSLKVKAANVAANVVLVVRAA
jgi:large subunit ribosomal protein L9